VARATARERLEDALAKLDGAPYELTLFVSGASTSSTRAVRNARALCEDHLAGRHHLNIVDVNQGPELARGRRVLATPTLIRDRPAPERMLVGDLSHGESVLAALDISVVEEADVEPTA
jgi:circadian clock protein KaiB